MTAIEQAKKNIARAEELERAVKDGKKVECKSLHNDWIKSRYVESDQFWGGLQLQSCEYRIIEPKRRRPWTREEADRHVGWVLVSPSGSRGLILGCNQDVIRHGGSEGNPPYEVACKQNWHVHLPGQPDDLKPCSVEK